MTVRLIVFTLAVLSLVNAYSYVRLYSSTTFSSPTTTQKISSRTPAAIASTSVETFSSDYKTRLTMDLNCGKANAAVEAIEQKVGGQWAQLKGKLCRSDKLKLVEITNLQNGFTASVFPLGSQNYQTDLIQLDQGSNKIRVRITPVKGAVEEQTVVIKSQPI